MPEHSTNISERQTKVPPHRKSHRILFILIRWEFIQRRIVALSAHSFRIQCAIFHKPAHNIRTRCSDCSSSIIFRFSPKAGVCSCSLPIFYHCRCSMGHCARPFTHSADDVHEMSVCAGVRPNQICESETESSAYRGEQQQQKKVFFPLIIKRVEMG